jgi:hypothetical protein
VSRDGGDIAMATLVMLAGRLPSNSEPGGNFRPPDVQLNGVVNQHG